MDMVSFWAFTGHGIGLEIHEGPNVLNGNEKICQRKCDLPNETRKFIYLEFGGVRIEDAFSITEFGKWSYCSFS